MSEKETDTPLYHMLDIGAIVTIFSLFIFKHPFIEGVAQIVGIVPDVPNLYRVRFEGEQRVYERFVHAGEWQQNPDAMLRQLLDHWRLTVTPEIANEFFPNDPPAAPDPASDEALTSNPAPTANADAPPTPASPPATNEPPASEDDA